MVMIGGTDRLERVIHVDNDGKAVDNGWLIAKARNDPATFVQLYRRHYDAVLRYCVHRLLERQAAKDVTSAVFLSVVENFSRFKGDEQQFRSWLYKITTNAVNNHLRQAARRNILLKRACEQVNNQDSTDASAEKLALLREAVLTLRPRYQTITTLRFFENLKSTEIAKVLGCSAGTVRSQLARGLAKLREKLRVEEVSYPAGGMTE